MRDPLAGDQVRPKENIAQAELPAQLAFLDGLASEVSQGDVRVGKLVLEVDDGANLIALDGLGEAARCHLSAAIDLVLGHDPQPFAMRVLPAVVNKGDDGQHQGQAQAEKPVERRAHPASLQCGRRGEYPAAGSWQLLRKIARG